MYIRISELQATITKTDRRTSVINNILDQLLSHKRWGSPDTVAKNNHDGVEVNWEEREVSVRRFPTTNRAIEDQQHEELDRQNRIRLERGNRGMFPQKYGGSLGNAKEDVHGKTKTEKQHKRKLKLAEQIRELQQEKEYVRPRDDHIFPEDPEELIEQSSTNHLVNWLRLYRPTIFNSKKEAEKMMSIKIKRITKYF